VILLELPGDGGLVGAISGNGCKVTFCGVNVGADLVGDAVDLAHCVLDKIYTAGSELVNVGPKETWHISAPSQIYGVIHNLLSISS